MNAMRSQRMSSQTDPNVRTIPKWEGLITTLLILASENTSNAHAADIYNRWKADVLELRNEFESREATSRCKAVRNYLLEVAVILNDIQDRVSIMTAGVLMVTTLRIVR